MTHEESLATVAATPPAQKQRVTLWRRNPQAVAWLVLIVNFVVFAVLAVTVPVWVRNYLLHATSVRPADVTAVTGTVQLWIPRADGASAVIQSRHVPEGSSVVTDGIARALVTIPSSLTHERMLVTMQLFQDTAMRLEQAQTPKFRWSTDADQVNLKLEQGRLKISSTPGEGEAVTVRVQTANAVVTFGSGSFYITSQGEETQVMASFGQAQVESLGTTVLAEGGQRVDVLAGRPPSEPVVAALNLVKNGTFEMSAQPDWEQRLEEPPGLQPGQLTWDSIDGRYVIRFKRRTEDSAPSAVRLAQQLNRDVLAFDSLQLRMDLQLLYQSVPGGGIQNSEYPVFVDLFYTDIYGKELHWFQGFYYQDLPAGSNWPAPTGERVPLGTWYTYESPNLIEALAATRPARINSITISALGHDFESQIADVTLIAR